MPDSPLSSTIASYHLCCAPSSRGSERIYVAYFSEMPYCLAEASSRDGAIEELSLIAEPYLESIVADGGELPAPITDRAATGVMQITRLSGFVAGRLEGQTAISQASFGGISSETLNFGLAPA